MSSRPLQNRVAPDGSIHAVPERGAWMGNRGGRIHVDGQRLGRRRWASRAWIFCVLKHRDWHREVMGDGYTEQFFLDEATALAAGHRPCFMCQHARAVAFAEAFPGGVGRTRAGEMDRVLHGQRLGTRGTMEARDLPDGAMFSGDAGPVLAWRGKGHGWHFGGYGPAVALPGGVVEVLTPMAVLDVLRAGYRPQVDASVGG